MITPKYPDMGQGGMRSTASPQVGDRDPWPEPFYPICGAPCQSAYTCTAPDGHDGPHIASDGDTIVAVQARHQRPGPDASVRRR